MENIEKSCNTCKANKICDHNKYGFEDCGNYIPEDVVEVVRCCDCKRFMEYTNEGKVEGADGDCFIRMSYSLDHQFYAVKCDDFCSCGERRDA